MSAIAIREMPGAMKRLATKSLVGLAQADYDYKIPKLMMDQEGRRDQIMQDWLIAGGEGTSSSHKSGVDR